MHGGGEEKCSNRPNSFPFLQEQSKYGLPDLNWNCWGQQSCRQEQSHAFESFTNDNILIEISGKNNCQACCRLFESSTILYEWLIAFIPDPTYGVYQVFWETRSYAALRAADLDWMVGPGYSHTRGHNWPGEGGQGRNKQKRDLLTYAGSQLTRGGGAGQE